MVEPARGQLRLDGLDELRCVRRDQGTETVDDSPDGETRNFSKFHATSPALPSASGVS